MSLRLIVISFLLVACGPATSKPPAPGSGTEPGPAVVVDASTASGPDAAIASSRDCTLGTVLPAHVGSQGAIDCSGLERGKALTCITDALAKSQPFVFHETLQGIDSAVERGLAGRIEKDSFIPFAASYDSDPCGGSCGWRGGSTISRCKRLRPALKTDACKHSISDCFECEAPVEEVRCQRGDDPAKTP